MPIPDTDLPSPQAELRRLRVWAEPARLILYDYRRAYAADRDPPDGLDAAAEQLLRDWEPEER